ncbi:MAG: DUF3124 domain-containing protein [bacterium]
MKYAIPLLLFLFILSSCDHQKFELHYDHDNVAYIDKAALPELSIHKNIYVPAYSDIYYETEDKVTYLTVILSVRNISFKDTIYVDGIEYYNSSGKLVHSYIDKVLMLRPMESMEYIVRSTDKKGGSGANFVVSYHAAEHIKNLPLIESVMMGNLDNYRFSFTSRGVEINP